MGSVDVNKIKSVYDQKMIKKSTFLNEFMWLCYGANPEILRQCPTDYAKYAGMGGTILFTAIMASMSGGYALFSVFSNVFVAMAFGIFWGMLIFNLDRFIVNTMYSDGEESISRKELLLGLPRIVIAIFLGIVISMPLELRIFETEIKVEIGELKKDLMAASVATEKHALDSLSHKRDELANSPIDPTAGISITSGSEKINILLQQKNEKLPKWQEWNKKVNILNEQITSFDKSDPTKIDQYNKLVESLQQAKVEMNNLSQQLSEINGKVQSEGGQLDNNLKKAVEQRAKDIALLDQLIADRRNEIKSIESGKIEDLKQYNGFQAKMLAFSRLRDKNPSTNTAGYFIMFLFIIIECAPTLFKMMIKRGPYDDRLEAEMYIQKVESQKIKSDINDDINTLVQISSEKNRIKLESELLSNKQILEEIANAQAEIISLALKSWKEEELRKVAENPSLYIKKSFEV